MSPQSVQIVPEKLTHNYFFMPIVDVRQSTYLHLYTLCTGDTCQYLSPHGDQNRIPKRQQQQQHKYIKIPKRILRLIKRNSHNYDDSGNEQKYNNLNSHNFKPHRIYGKKNK